MSVLGQMESIFLKFCGIWDLRVAEIWRRGVEPTRILEHITRFPGTHSIGGNRDIQTILVFEASNTRSLSPILQDFVWRGAHKF